MLERPAVRTLRGTVFLPDGAPMGAALVEVFDHPEVVTKLIPDEAAKVQHRIAACITNGTGRFFLKVPPGPYEVRIPRLFR